MRLIGLSILLGIVGVILAFLTSSAGSDVNGNFVFAMWIMGFFSPSIYVLDKLYKKIKNKEF
ncbi:hypothetical protein [Clostridium lundense]|uniref:hypothetical protein n=1 Tax=Clostridium lundense TaxID=319475 RepID=UPI0004864FFC|nr:hypothetical protein [Clostridium lundense]